MNNEYRKAMYRNGEYTSVGNAEEEAEKRAEGWTDWYTDQDRMSGKAPVASTEPVVHADGDDHMRLIAHVVRPADLNSAVEATAAAIGQAKRKPGRPPKAK